MADTTPPLPPEGEKIKGIEEIESERLNKGALRSKNESTRDYGQDGPVVLETDEVPEEAVTPAKHVSSKARMFLDERGDVTYFFMNVSNGIVVLTDIHVKIPAGSPVDLLDMADEREIIKSKDLRVSQRPAPVDGSVLLKRLTPEEFEKLYSEYQKTQRVIAQKRAERADLFSEAEKNPEAFKMLSNREGQDKTSIRPQVQSLVEKLRFGDLDVNDKEAKDMLKGKQAGISAEEFLLRFKTLQPSRDELDYVFQVTRNRDVRKTLQKEYDLE